MNRPQPHATAPWPTSPLGDLCEVNIGRTPARAEPAYWGPGVQWLSIADMNQGRHLTTTKETITSRAVTECGCRLVGPGTVLLSFKLSIGKVGITTRPMCTNEAIASLPIRNSKRLSADFLYWALQSLDLTAGQDRAAMGATLNKPKLLGLEIPVPPLSKQQRIAKILDAAEALREKRRVALAQVDTVTEAIFIEMFGDPLTNPREWPVAAVRDIATTTSGGTPDRGEPAYFGGDVPWVKSGELHQGFVTQTEETLTQRGVAESSAKLMPIGTVLVAMYGATVGAVATLGIEATTNQAICCIRLGGRVQSPYFVSLLKLMTPTLLLRRVGGAQPNLSQDLIRSLTIPVPPLPLQQTFARRAAAAEKLKAAHRASLGEMDALFASLQHRAFRGEL